MASRNNRLRTNRDLRQRKKLNDSTSWEKRMLESLIEVEQEQPKQSEHKRNKSNRETAKLLNAEIYKAVRT